MIIKVLKIVGGLMISIGVGGLVKNVLVMVTPPGAKAVMRVCMMVGGYFIGSLAAKAASDEFEKKVDKTVLSLKNINKNEEIIEIIRLETELKDGT